MDIVGPITPQGCEYKLNIICLRSIGVLLDRLHRKKKKYSHIYIHIGVNLYEVSVYLCVKAFIYAHSQGYETYMEYPYEHVIYFAPATKNKMPETY